jgi:uncharacterized membrane-anchored protein YhcB (DUF1043 family)
MTFELPILILAGTVTFAVGVLLGRQTGNNRREVNELRAKLETSGKERELAQASVDAAKDEIKRTRDELDRYRGEVVEHFTGTSQLLRDLTLQYRAVYDHLATGASGLCPEGSVSFLESGQTDALEAGDGAAPSARFTGEIPEAGAESETAADTGATDEGEKSAAAPA